MQRAMEKRLARCKLRAPGDGCGREESASRQAKKQIPRFARNDKSRLECGVNAVRNDNSVVIVGRDKQLAETG
jgi:hypothetical protein